jgi:hypothetical protein
LSRGVKLILQRRGVRTRSGRAGMGATDGGGRREAWRERRDGGAEETDLTRHDTRPGSLESQQSRRKEKGRSGREWRMRAGWVHGGREWQRSHKAGRTVCERFGGAARVDEYMPAVGLGRAAGRASCCEARGVKRES